METQLKKKYGLFTAISMVVGIVIGSGVFFKAEKILTVTGGDLPLGILAWVVGGVIMMVCSYVFAVMATKYEYVNGVVDYSEVTVGKKYGYMVGWFFATIYYPTLTSVLAWVSARYTAVLLGWSIVGPECMTIAAFFLIASYAINALSPKIAGKFQVTTTVIKLIPLLLMGIVGCIVGFTNGMTFRILPTRSPRSLRRAAPCSQPSAQRRLPMKAGSSQRASMPSFVIRKRTCLSRSCLAR
jgi:APA family basic amino acid/polyamine antiporter